MILQPHDVTTKTWGAKDGEQVRKSGIFGMFRKPVGGREDIVLVPAGETCVICMEAFKPNEVLQVLLCQHLYHDR